MVYLFLANGFEEVEALAPLDLLRRAGVAVTTVAIGGSDMVVGSHGIAVQADIPEALYRDSSPEMVILPGGMPGSTNLDASKTVDAALRAASRNGYLAAICAAPMVLGKRGYLQGKTAVCYPGFEEHLLGAHKPAEGVRVVTDGNTVTAAGMGVAIEFGLALVRLLKGDEMAEALRRTTLAD